MPDGVTSIAEYYRSFSNRNLLRNAYWAAKESIVNQLGLIEYVNSTYGQYCIDGWRSGGGVRRISLMLHSLRMVCENTSSSAWCLIRQQIENGQEFRGQTVTFSCMYKSIEGGVPWLELMTDTQFATCWSAKASEDWMIASLTAVVPENAEALSAAIELQQRGIPGVGVDLLAAKLELGPFQTLAHMEGNTWVLNDPPPNYALELLKCQRYFVRMKNTESSAVSIGFGSKTAHNKVAITVPLAVPMRIKPTVKCSDPSLLRVVGSTGEQYDVTSFYGEVLSANQLRISVTGNFSDMPYGLCVLCINSNGCIDIDANL